MIAVSDKYLELINSNVRPELKPKIIVKYKVDGIEESLEWSSSNILDLSYKRGVDPFGRSLPYMELVWKERLTSKLMAEEYTKRFENIVKYASVTFSFIQKLGFEKDAETEEITFPIMFVSSKPEVVGQEIIWTARDLLYFLNKVQSKSFDSGIPFENPIRWFLADERARFRDNEYGVYSISQTDIINFWFTGSTIDDLVLFDGETKSLLMNYASTRNKYWSFKDNYLTLNSISNFLENKESVFSFERNIYRKEPTTKTESDISSYNFKTYVVNVNEDNAYEVLPTEQSTIGNATYYYYAFPDLAKPISSGAVLPVISRSTYATVDSLTLAPVTVNGVEASLENNISGDAYNEDNPLNTYTKESDFIKQRFEFLKKYFSSKNNIIEIESLSNLALEPGDVVDYASNQYETKNEITNVGGIPVVIPVVSCVMRKAIITEVELIYKGGLKQKTKLHEVIYGD